MPDGGSGLNRRQRRLLERVRREARSASGVGQRSLWSVRAVPLAEARLDPAAIAGYLGLAGALAHGETRLCGACEHVFAGPDEVGAVVLMQAAGDRSSVASCAAICARCCADDLRAATERVARMSCGPSFRALDEAHLAAGGRA